MLCIEKVSFSYTKNNHDRQVFHRLDLSFPSKGLIGIVGNNGVGKSTLFKLLAGRLMPQEGTITWSKKNSYQVAYMEQHGHLIPSIPVKQQWALFRRTIPSSMWDKKYEIHLKEIFHFSSFEHTLTDVISGGEKGRLLLMMTLMTPAHVYLLDEPTASLDDEMKVKVKELLLQCGKHHLVLWISHDTALFDEELISILILKAQGYDWKNGNVPSYPNPIKYVTLPQAPSPVLTSGLQEPPFARLIGRFIFLLGSLCTLLVGWFSVHLDQVMLQHINPTQEGYFFQLQIKEVQTIENSTFSLVQYRQIIPSERQTISTHWSHHLFLIDYSLVLPSFLPIANTTWMLRPYDDSNEKEPLLRVNQAIAQTEITFDISPFVSWTLSVDPIQVSPRWMEASTPILYYPYFFTYKKLQENHDPFQGIDQYWWFIKGTAWNPLNIKKLFVFQSTTNFQLLHPAWNEWVIYQESFPLIQGLVGLLGFVYLGGWIALDIFVIQLFYEKNHAWFSWMKWQYGGKRILHKSMDALMVTTLVLRMSLFFLLWLIIQIGMRDWFHQPVGVDWSMLIYVFLGFIFMIIHATVHEINKVAWCDSHH